MKIPRDQTFHPGERWTPELGLDFIKLKSRFPENFVTSEVSRYLGIPGQAISYKVGEREWLSAREESRRQLGADFDLKEWHTRALSLGADGVGADEAGVGRGLGIGGITLAPSLSLGERGFFALPPLPSPGFLPSQE